MNIGRRKKAEDLGKEAEGTHQSPKMPPMVPQPPKPPALQKPPEPPVPETVPQLGSKSPVPPSRQPLAGTTEPQQTFPEDPLPHARKPPAPPSQQPMQEQPRKSGSSGTTLTSPPMVQQNPAKAPAAPTQPHVRDVPHLGEKLSASTSGQPNQVQPQKPQSVESVSPSPPAERQKSVQAPSDPVVHNAANAAQVPAKPPGSHDQTMSAAPKEASVPHVERTPTRPPYVEAPQKPRVDTSVHQPQQAQPQQAQPQQAQMDPSMHQPRQTQA